MNFQILASTNFDNKNIKNRFDEFSGELAGICYMQSDLKTIQDSELSKKLKRTNMIKENGHHSVFDHEYITLYFEDVPKFFAMILNNEQMYTTSEKSARYTKMNIDGTEKELYDKWLNIFKKLIPLKYPNEPYFTEKRIEKLAQENARYFISVFTPTCFAYTVSFRQLNYLYSFFKNADYTNKYFCKLKPTIDEFLYFLENNDLIDEKLYNFAKNRQFSIFSKKECKEYFGDVYVTKYLGSFAEFAQAQRHRTLNYSFADTPYTSFYIPKLIEKNEKLKQMWLEDMQKVKDNIPQATLIQIQESGTYENFMLKANERLCTCAQLEIENQTKITLQKYIYYTTDEEIKNTLLTINKGARCLSNFKCNTPCKFPDGIKLDREI